MFSRKVNQYTSKLHCNQNRLFEWNISTSNFWFKNISKLYSGNASWSNAIYLKRIILIAYLVEGLTDFEYVTIKYKDWVNEYLTPNHTSYTLKGNGKRSQYNYRLGPFLTSLLFESEGLFMRIKKSEKNMNWITSTFDCIICKDKEFKNKCSILVLYHFDTKILEIKKPIEPCLHSQHELTFDQLVDIIDRY